MSSFTRHGATLHYTETGKSDGPAILLIAPGGMRSCAAVWERIPWSPLAALADSHRLIAMDQRNAGRSWGPVSAEDGWHTYTADQLALMDHLGIDRFHVLGMCIGGPYIMGLIAAAPERVVSALMFQPIGLDENRQAFYDMFDAWQRDIAADHPEATAEDWAAFREAMYGGEFMFNTSRGDVRACETPVLLFMGNDLYHPESTSREFAQLAPNVRFIETWKTQPEAAEAAVRDFLGV